VLIDWFTVGAQIVNFIVLVWLLKRFMYQPILNAINARERRISDELQDASQQRAAAQSAREDLASKNNAFDAERATLLASAVTDSGRERERLMVEARNDLDALRTKQYCLLQNEQVAQSAQVTRLVAGEVFAIARSALKDLAGTDLEDRMAQILARRLREMTPEDKVSWNAVLKGSGTGATVRSRFDLTTSSRAIIQAAVSDGSSIDIPLRFEAGSEGICGIELIACGQKLSWTLGDYLNTLELKVDGLLKNGAAKLPPASPPRNSPNLVVARPITPLAPATVQQIPVAAAS
jgi:F-type H+-transporting ATPase subunit b